MKITLRSNQASAFALMAANQKQISIFNSISKPSSGFSIVKAADNPAGLVISEQLRSQIASLNQKIENLNLNINRHKAASGTVSELRSLLTEVRTLAIGAVNSGGNSDEAQAAFAIAGDALVDSFNIIKQNANFNGQATLDGSDGSLADIADLTNVDLSTPEGAAAAVETIDAAAAELDQATVDIGATQKNELESQRVSFQVTQQNLVSAESQIRDVDLVREYSKLVSASIGLQVSLALLAHSNLSSKSVIRLLDL